MQSNPIIFDRKQVRRQRDRAATTMTSVDFLLKDGAERIGEALDMVARAFPLALDLGSRDGFFTHPKIGQLVRAELSMEMLKAADGLRVQCDEEWLPFAEHSFDLVISNLNLHWVNDLPGVLAQIQRVLKPDGMFIAVMFGGVTLQELREAALAAGMQHGVTPRVIPFVDLQQAGALLQRAGFALPVVDGDMLSVSYAHPLTLMQELRKMGEGNALSERRRVPATRKEIMDICERYMAMFADEEKRIPASFEMVMLTGWKPHASQQQPAKRGSGKVNLKNVL